MSDQNNQDGTTNDKLYAGKFKTIEDLETGYKNSAAVFDENEKLKKELEELKTLPSDYVNPADVTHEESRIADIKARAKAAGMTQAQYEKFLRDDKARVDARKDAFEKNKKELGDETLNILKDYTNKYYPAELAPGILDTFIQNKVAREAALKHRDQLLNNQVPGMQKPPVPPVGYHVSDADVRKAYDAKEKNKGDAKARDHYLRLVEAQAAQKRG